MDTMITFDGSIKLARWPRYANDPLRAWDAADEYLLRYVFEQGYLNSTINKNVLIVNDNHGALACALHTCKPVSWSDSYVAHASARSNYKMNQFAMPLNTLSSMQSPDGLIDLVLIRVPKTTALLEDQLAKLVPHLHERSVVIAAGMIKHLQSSAFSVIEKAIGPVSTSLAVKKARLIVASFDMTLKPTLSPYPSSYKELGLSLINHANVFSRERLDPGTRFLLAQYDQLPSAERMIDLACGNGVLGIKYKQLYSTADVLFIDESYMAIASAQENYKRAFPGSEQGSCFSVADGLDKQVNECSDLIVCNPPFHQQHTVGVGVAKKLFKDSKRCLRTGGELWVVANSHLMYADHLRRVFGHCRKVASTRKFSVLQAKKR